MSTIEYPDQNKDPSYVGDFLTTHCIPKKELLSRFALDDHNFPLAGVHTQMDLEVAETQTCVQISFNP